MRADTTAFVEANSNLNKEPRFAIEVAFDDAANDLVYFTGHDDTPLPNGATSYDGILDEWSATSQTLKPEQANASIGNINFAVTDLNQTVRQLLASKYNFGRSLKGKRVRAYLNYKGSAWSDAALVQTQIIGNTDTKDGQYSFSCSDVQRFLKKKLFVLATTTLQNSVSETDTTIAVYDTSNYEPVAHGTSYSDAPGQTVYYFKIDKEYIRATGKTATTFTGCTRGVLNTKAVRHDINPGASADRRTTVEELVYLEMPAPKLALALLTGELYGQGATLPNSWHAEVDATYVRNTSFTGIGSDLWDPTDDTKGLMVRFIAESNKEAKKFIEEQLMLLMGCYMPIHGDGAFGLRRMVQVLSDAPYVKELTVDNTTTYSVLKHELSEVRNRIYIDWNWESTKKEFTRHQLLIDNISAQPNRYGPSDILNLKFRGLHGSLHTGKTLEALFERLRDRFTSEPLRLTVGGFFSLNNIEVGDIVKLNMPHIQDYVADSYLDRSFEVQRVSVDWITGRVTLNLFGSTYKQSPTIVSNEATTVSAAWWTSEGTNINTLAGYSAGSLTTNVSIGGHTDLNNAAAIYYHDGDLTIPNGVTLTIADNIQLRIKGFLTVNGIIDGKGNGITTASTKGYVGTAKAQGNIYRKVFSKGAPTVTSSDVPVTSGLHNAAPELQIIYDDGAELLNGLPSDLRGSTGSAGGTARQNDDLLANGGAHGNSGAGLAIVSQGMGFGVSGNIDLSGDAGVTGTLHGYGIASGAGAGGSSGTLYSILDGNASVATIGNDNFISLRGSSPPRATAATSPQYTTGDVLSSYYVGFSSRDSWQSNHRVQYIPSVEVAEVDQSTGPLTPPTLLSASSGASLLLKHSDGSIIPRVLLSFTPAVDSRVVGYEVQYKLSVDSSWDTSTSVLGAEIAEAIVMGVTSGLLYDFRIRSASGDGLTSGWLQIVNELVVGKTAPPANVASFDVYQNGPALVMKWPGVDDLDLAGYEIRYLESGGSGLWLDATILTAVTKGTNVTTVDIPDGTWLMMIKAVDTSGNYSTTEATKTIVFSSSFDVIDSTTFAPGFAGTLTNMVLHHTGKLVPQSQNLASADGWDTFDIAVPNPYLDCYYEVAEYDNGFDDESRVSSVIDSYLAPGEASGAASPELQIDHRLSAGSYDGFENWSAGNVNFRYLKARVHVDTSVGVAIITEFNRIIDALEFTQKAESVAVSSSGTTITYPVPFHLKPYIDILVISTTAVNVAVSPKSATQFTVRLFNSSGAAIAGTIDWKAIGV